MKKMFFVVAVLFVLMFTYPIQASTPSKDWKIVKELCKPYHKPIKLISGNSRKNTSLILHRKNKNYILVEKVISRSSGKNFGYTLKDNYYIAYNKKVKKGTKVISYIIYNFNSNEPDEILFVVDCNRYRR